MSIDVVIAATHNEVVARVSESFAILIDARPQADTPFMVFTEGNM